MQQGLISVVIPTYNVGAAVREAVDSVLGQTWTALEVIVVDDGSTDDTMTFLEDLEDPRLTILTKPNGGVSTARNAGIAVAAGEWIGFLDADDVWDADKLARTIPEMGEHAVVGSMMRYIDEAGRASRSAAGEDPTVGSGPERIRRAEFMPFPLSSMVFTAEAVAAAGPWDASLRFAQDLDFLARVARHGSVGWIGEPLGGYRLRPSAASSKHFAAQRRHMRFIQERLRRRDAGGDLEWAEFDQIYAPTRGERRLDYAAGAYRDGGLALSAGRWQGAFQVMGAVVVAPRYAVPRLVRHVQAMRG